MLLRWCMISFVPTWTWHSNDVVPLTQASFLGDLLHDLELVLRARRLSLVQPVAYEADSMGVTVVVSLGHVRLRSHRLFSSRPDISFPSMSTQPLRRLRLAVVSR